MRRRSSSKGQIERDERQHPRLGEHAGHLTGPAHVLGAVPVREAEVAVEPVAQVVAVEQEGGPAAVDERLFHRGGQGRLAGPRQAGEQHRTARRAQRGEAFAPGEPAAVAHHVRAGVRGGDHPDDTGADRAVGRGIDDDEAAGRTVRRVVVHQERLGGAERDTADLVEVEGLGVLVAVQPVDVESVLQGMGGDAHRPRTLLDEVGAADGERGPLVHPADRRLDVRGQRRPVVGTAQHVAP